MPPEHTPHTLLRIAGVQALLTPAVPPPWVGASLLRAPWVVVRRAEFRSGLVPAGVRGERRAERLAAWIDGDAILERVTPCDLARMRSWQRSPRQRVIPALAVLDAVHDIMSCRGFADAWGPTGSIGFELATGCPTATAGSDLDLALWTVQQPGIELARSLLAALATLPVRSDALLETPRGALTLAEYASGGRRVVLRTTGGPRLVDRQDDCFGGGGTVAA